MSGLIFFVYALAFCFLIIQLSFFKKSALSNYWLIGLFFIKITAGCIYGWFYSLPAVIQTSDTWRYFHAAEKETDMLLSNPVAFIKELFVYSYNSSGNLFIAHNSYWNNLKDNLLIKILAVINVFSFKNYYADVIFFNFFFFVGCVAFYRLIKTKIKANKFILIAFVFCIPSVLFWCSGIHKDGFVFTAIALCIYYFNEWITTKRVSIKAILIFTFCALMLFAFRNFVLILLLPALATWYLCDRYPKRKFLLVTCIYGLIILIFFISSSFSLSLNFPAYIVNKQNEFKTLGGNSQLMLPELKPAFTNFIQFFPYAIDTAFLRPHLTEISNSLYLPAIAENIFLYALIFFSTIIAYRKRMQNVFNEPAKAFIIFCFVFAISNLLLMGYTVTLTGAIVRYRSFVLPFLIAPLSVFINIENNKPNNTLVS